MSFIDLELAALDRLTEELRARQSVLLRGQGRIMAGASAEAVEQEVREEVGGFIVETRCPLCEQRAVLCVCPGGTA